MLPNWMASIADATPLTQLSIPGTHNSGATKSIFGALKCQNNGIEDQLKDGIRFLDIRLRHYQDHLFVHHDRLFEGIDFPDVLKMCADFLEKNSTETILMLVNHETSSS